MLYEALGNTELKVSKVSFGTAPLGDMFGTVGEKEAIAVVRAAMDRGINFFDSAAYYGKGLAEVRLGKAIKGCRGEVIVSTKAGRNGRNDFDFTAKGIQDSLDKSLRLLGTDYLDIFQLHDIEFDDLDRVFDESYRALVEARQQGKCRYIGMTGYPLHTMRRAMKETDLDVVLTYAHYTLLDTQLRSDLLPSCHISGTAVINAAAVALGLLTPGGSRLQHPAGHTIRAAAARVVRFCADRAIDVAFLANQFSIQRCHCATTVVGTAKLAHLESAVTAATTPIDEQLLTAVLQRTTDVRNLSWRSGRPENNG